MTAVPAKLGAAPARRLFLLPGAGADPTFWRPLGERLPGHWEKRYFGWPGLGDQAPSVAVRGFDDLVAMVAAEIDDRPVDLLAQSMGGAIALRLALDHPQRIRRLVLTVTAGGLDVSALGAADWRADYRQAYPQAHSWILDTRPDYHDELGKITQPTLLLWGDADPISPLAVGERLRDLLPNASLVKVAGGNHALAHERAAELAELVTAHLA